jgi:hypothetical protein
LHATMSLKPIICQGIYETASREIQVTQSRVAAALMTS